jgi:aspartate ammonia-lyase
LILLSSSPNGAGGEIQLPAVQPGSSIMPGKINPVIPILMQQVAFGIVGNDSSVSLASLNGQLEINHFEPIIAARLFDSIDLLTKSARIFAQSCIAGIEANREQSLDNLLASSAMATVFVPRLGYAQTSELVRLSLKERRPLVELAVERGLLEGQDLLTTLRQSTIRKDSKV